MGKRKRKPASQGTTISTLSSSQSSAPPQTTTMEMNFSPSQLYSPSEMLAASNNILYGQPAIPHLSFNTPVIPSAPNTTPIQPRLPPPFLHQSPQSPQSIPQGLERYFNDINNKLSKLDLLDNIVQRLSGLENQYAGFQTQMVQLRADINKVTARVDGGERQRQIFENTVINLENQKRDLQQQNYELNEEFLKMQTRTMKDNLIIAGIPEYVDENTETVIKTFINDVLKVPGDIPLHVAHRLRKRRDRRLRSIVAKFEHRKDRDRVLEVVKTGVLNETDFSVNEQYPVAVNERRQALLPKLREEKRKNNRAFIRYDKLYVNGIPWNPPPIVPDVFQQRNGPNPGPVI